MSLGERTAYEFDQLFCKPRARCFKGLAILSGIYALACLMMLAFIPPVINAHGYEPSDEISVQDSIAIGNRLDKMIKGTWISAAIFFALAVINIILTAFFSSKEKK